MKKLIGILLLGIIFTGCTNSENITCPCIVVKSEVHGSNYLLTVSGPRDADDKDNGNNDKPMEFQFLYNEQRNIGDTVKLTISKNMPRVVTHVVYKNAPGSGN